MTFAAIARWLDFAMRIRMHCWKSILRTLGSGQLPTVDSAFRSVAV